MAVFRDFKYHNAFQLWDDCRDFCDTDHYASKGMYNWCGLNRRENSFEKWQS